MSILTAFLFHSVFSSIYVHPTFSSCPLISFPFWVLDHLAYISQLCSMLSTAQFCDGSMRRLAAFVNNQLLFNLLEKKDTYMRKDYLPLHHSHHHHPLHQTWANLHRGHWPGAAGLILLLHQQGHHPHLQLPSSYRTGTVKIKQHKLLLPFPAHTYYLSHCSFWSIHSFHNANISKLHSRVSLLLWILRSFRVADIPYAVETSTTIMQVNT